MLILSRLTLLQLECPRITQGPDEEGAATKTSHPLLLLLLSSPPPLAACLPCCCCCGPRRRPPVFQRMTHLDFFLVGLFWYSSTQRMASSNTALSPSCVSAEHSRYA